MSKTKALNRTITTVLILLLTLSMLSVININILELSPVAAHPDPGITLDPSSGKVKSTFKVNGTGFGDTASVGIGFNITSVTCEKINGTQTTDGTTTKFNSTEGGQNLASTPIKEGTIFIWNGSTCGATPVQKLNDTDKDGILTDVDGNDRGYINYTTGEWSVNFQYAPLSGDFIWANYTGYTYDITPAGGVTTNSTGYFETTCTVPLVATGDYTVGATNRTGSGSYSEASFTVQSGITLSPSVGVENTSLTVYGSGFTASGTVDIYFDADNDTSPEPGELEIDDGAVSADGTFSLSFYVPAVTVGYGRYMVWAYDGTNSDTAWFTVGTPIIAISPTRGTAGTPLTIAINYFTRTSTAGTVQVFFDTDGDGVVDIGEPLVNVAWADLNNTGGNSSISLTVPTTISYGTYNVIAQNAVPQTASTTFTVEQPVITISPTSGVAGLTIDIYINYFNKTSGAGDVAVWMDVNKNGTMEAGEHIVTIHWDTGLNETGGNHTTGALPSASPDTYYVYANNTIQTANTTYTVMSPELAISPTKGTAGTTINVTINYFDPTKDVDVWIDMNNNGTMESGELIGTIPNAYINDTGYNFTQNLGSGIPDGIGYGTYYVYANNTAQTANTTFTVEHPVLVITPTKGTAGTLIDVSLNYFNKTSGAGNVEVWIDMNGNGTKDAGETIGTIAYTYLNNTGGNVTTNLGSGIPAGIGYGTYDVYASNTVQNATDTFTVEHPVLVVSPTKGTAGTNMTVSINYFNKTSGAGDVTVWIDMNGNGTMESGELRRTIFWSTDLNNTGGNTTWAFIPDSIGYGTYDVYANNTLQSVNTTFTVEHPVVAVSPTSGGSGTTVTVTINYFNKTSGAGNTYVFFDSDSDGVYDVGEPRSGPLNPLNNTGGNITTLSVPTVSTGAYNITGYNDLQSAYAQFTVVSPCVDAITSAKTEILASVNELELKLDNATYGLVAIKTALTEIEAKLDNSTYGLVAIKNAIDTGFTSLRSFITEKVGIITEKIDAVEAKLDNSTYGLVAIKNAVDAIKAKTDTIDWTDIATIKTAVTHVSTRKFDFGTSTSLWEPGFVQVTPSTNYTTSQGYGWTNTTGLYARDRGAPDDARKDFVFSSENRTFQVDLTNGDYTVIVTLGDQSYSHDNMNITVEGNSAILNSTAGTFVQKVFHVTVTDGSLTVTMKDDGGVDPNWVINTLIIEQSWK